MAARCGKEFEWTEEKCNQLRELWATDMTAADIGVRMRISKSSVTSKAHRLLLPPRESPIVRSGVSHRAIRVKGPTLPGVDAAADHSATKPHIGCSLPSPRTCQWIDGHRPFTPDKFCGQPIMRGAYCDDHHRRCYIGATQPTNSTFNLPARGLPIP